MGMGCFTSCLSGNLTRMTSLCPSMGVPMFFQMLLLAVKMLSPSGYSPCELEDHPIPHSGSTISTVHHQSLSFSYSHQDITHPMAPFLDNRLSSTFGQSKSRFSPSAQASNNANW